MIYFLLFNLTLSKLAIAIQHCIAYNLRMCVN